MVLRPVVPIQTGGILRGAAQTRQARAGASLTEQRAAEEPAAAEHRRWQRGEQRSTAETKKQREQHAFELGEEIRLIGRAEEGLRRASDARGALSVLEKLIPKGQEIPVEIQQMAEELQGTINRPVAFKKLIGEMLDWGGERKAGLKKIQTKYEAKFGMKKTKAEVAGRKEVAEIYAAGRENLEQFKAKLKAGEKLSSVDKAKVRKILSDEYDAEHFYEAYDENDNKIKVRDPDAPDRDDYIEKREYELEHGEEADWRKFQ